MGPPGRPKITSTPWATSMSTMASAVLVGSVAVWGAIASSVLNAGLSIRVILPRAPRRSTPQLLLQPEVLEQHLQIHRFLHAHECPRLHRVLLHRLCQMCAIHEYADVARVRS